MKRWKGLALVLFSAVALSAQADESAQQQLLARYSTLEQALLHNQFQRPVVLDSQESSRMASGEIYAITAYSFPVVNNSLNNPQHWCDVMSLHINTKYCRPEASAETTILKVNVGKKTPQQLKDTDRLEFTYTTLAQTPEYFAIQLSSQKGLMGTRDYLIELEAIPLPDGRTFLHLQYSCSMSVLARLAIKTYLATIGSNKVGFTSTGTNKAGMPVFIGGLRALMERNTMRYYLAIDSFLAAASESGKTPAEQLEWRLQRWFTAVEQYPRQLHELERHQYITMKLAEHLRQKTAD